MNTQDCFIGLDVSKDTLDVGVRPTGERKTFANQEDGLSAMIDFIKPLSPRLIVLEATGGLEKAAMVPDAEEKRQPKPAGPGAGAPAGGEAERLHREIIERFERIQRRRDAEAGSL